MNQVLLLKINEQYLLEDRAKLEFVNSTNRDRNVNLYHYNIQSPKQWFESKQFNHQNIKS